MATKRKNDAKGAEISKGSQAANYQEMVTAENGDRLRVAIHADTYKFQGYARVERWDGVAWQRVWALDPLRMQTETNLAYVARDLTHYDFKLDRDRLLGLAAAVLGVKVRA
jgi:hypothetical protein